MSVAKAVLRFFEADDRPPNDRELAELGLSRLDYNTLVKSPPGTRARMEAIAARFGVTPEMIDRSRGLALDIAETCGACRQAGRCQRALDGKGTFDPADCPNAAVFRALAAG